MSKNNEPQGCLTTILGLFGISLENRIPEFQKLPYQKRDELLSKAELSFFLVLEQSVDHHITICPKIRLADIFKVSKTDQRQSYQNKINQKHLDFLLCDSKTMKPVLGIELDDSSHNNQNTIQKNKFKDLAFESAGLKLLRIPVSRNYSPLDLREQINSFISVPLNVAAASKNIPALNDVPNCPECRSPMTLRTAKQGKNKGQQFWGCSNYPKCKKIIRM